MNIRVDVVLEAKLNFFKVVVENVSLKVLFVVSLLPVQFCHTFTQVLSALFALYYVPKSSTLKPRPIPIADDRVAPDGHSGEVFLTVVADNQILCFVLLFEYEAFVFFTINYAPIHGSHFGNVFQQLGCLRSLAMNLLLKLLDPLDEDVGRCLEIFNQLLFLVLQEVDGCLQIPHLVLELLFFLRKSRNLIFILLFGTFSHFSKFSQKLINFTFSISKVPKFTFGHF